MSLFSFVMHCISICIEKHFIHSSRSGIWEFPAHLWQDIAATEMAEPCKRPKPIGNHRFQTIPTIARHVVLINPNFIRSHSLALRTTLNTMMINLYTSSGNTTTTIVTRRERGWYFTI